MTLHAAQPGQGGTTLADRVAAAFVYAYPLYAVAATRQRAVADPGNPDGHPPNTLRHERRLSDHRARWITTPNNDTLYSNAWIDLSRGPVRLQVDAMPPGRYWSVALLDAWTNNFLVTGQRDVGAGPLDLLLLGPDDAAPAAGAAPGGPRTVRAPGQDVWLFARCLVDGPHDLPAAHAMQDRLHLHAPAVERSPAAAAGQSTDPRHFLAVVNAALARNPPPPQEQALRDGWADVGLRPGEADVWERLSPEVRAAWTDGIAAAHDRLRLGTATGRRVVQGWHASAPDMGDFGANHGLRASVALGGLGALPASEAVYFVRFHDDAGSLLDGCRAWRLRVPASGIPAGAFWSLSMYAPAPDGQRFFVDNPIGRYAVSDRTPGLVTGPDGVLELTLQHAAPDDARLRANWLPAPAGPFQIALRAYLPLPSLRDGTAAMPSIVPA